MTLIWKWSPGFYLYRIASFVLVNNFSVTWRWTLSCLFFFFEQSLLLCIHNNVSVNNEWVRTCIVRRASLNVLWFLHLSSSFQNRTTGYHIFSFAGVSDCKRLIGWGFCDIQNNQGRGRGYQPKPKAEADNPYRDLDYSGYHKNRI